MNTDQILKNWNSYTAGEVTTSTKIHPDKIDVETYGNHCSYVNNGDRIWRFESSQGYFKFLGEFYNYIIFP